LFQFASFISVEVLAPDPLLGSIARYGSHSTVSNGRGMWRKLVERSARQGLGSIARCRHDRPRHPRQRWIIWRSRHAVADLFLGADAVRGRLLVCRRRISWRKARRSWMSSNSVAAGTGLPRLTSRCRRIASWCLKKGTSLTPSRIQMIGNMRLAWLTAGTRKIYLNCVAICPPPDTPLAAP
jgi:hypothetical protein